MKKIILMSAVLVFALTFGLAYAGEGMTKAKDMSAEWYNGITIFASGPILFDDGPAALGEGLDPGKLGAGVLAAGVDNGVTAFDRVQVSSRGSAAGGSGVEARSMEWSNGVTIFHTGPVIYE